MQKDKIRQEIKNASEVRISLAFIDTFRQLNGPKPYLYCIYLILNYDIYNINNLIG